MPYNETPMKGTIMANFANYREWRQELSNIQNSIDAFDEAFYDNPDNFGVNSEKSYADYMDERNKMCKKLEDHYKVEADYTN